MDDGMPEMRIGDAYARLLLEKWVEIVDLREDVMFLYLETDKKKKVVCTNPKLVKEYVTRLISLYGEVYPKVVGNVRFDKEIQDRIAKFLPHYYDPQLIFDGIEAPGREASPKRGLTLVSELDMLLREILEILKITAFDG